MVSSERVSLLTILNVYEGKSDINIEFILSLVYRNVHFLWRKIWFLGLWFMGAGSGIVRPRTRHMNPITRV